MGRWQYGCRYLKPISKVHFLFACKYSQDFFLSPTGSALLSPLTGPLRACTDKRRERGGARVLWTRNFEINRTLDEIWGILTGDMAMDTSPNICCISCINTSMTGVYLLAPLLYLAVLKHEVWYLFFLKLLLMFNFKVLQKMQNNRKPVYCPKHAHWAQGRFVFDLKLIWYSEYYSYNWYIYY